MLVSPSVPFPSGNPLASRALSAFEFCFGAFIVIGHNVFHIVPNEVIVLFVLVAAASRILLGQFLIEPVTSFFWPKPTAPAMANEITGNVTMALVALLLVWTFAAFGEEIAYRGYLLTRAADIGRRSVAAYWVGIVLVSILFGYGHYYKGASGVIDSGVAGLILGTAYMLAGRNLWVSIFAHGFIDTFGVIDAFFGWST